MFRALLVLFSVLSISTFSVSASANWQLEPDASRLNFMSIKNDNIAEVHTFDALEGSVSGSKLAISVPLSSVNTSIPIRNERIQSMLFDVANFPTATFTATISDKLLALKEGETTTADVPGVIKLHGKSVKATFSVRVTKAKDELVVATTKPYVLSVSDFGLTDGIDALRNIAKLKVISLAVPVSFSLVFTDK